MAQGMCSVEGCGRVEKLRRTWCALHYTRWKRHGDPLVTKNPNLYRSTVCIECGVDLPSVHQARKRCETCVVVVKRRRWREEYHRQPKEQILARMRAYREANPEKLDQQARKWYLRKMYGISVEDYDELVAKQKGLCLICEQLDTSGKRLAVDHHHDTGLVRGLLCARCNLGLGYFTDDPERLRRAAAYLEATC